MSKTFVDACLSGDAFLTEVEDWTERWHEGGATDQTLGEFLGFSPDEYRLWVEKPEVLRFIVSARASHSTVTSRLEEAAHSAELLAAREVEGGEARSVLEWLRAQGRI